MSDLFELFHYVIICPFICFTLSELLNFLSQTVSTTLRKTWEHFQRNARSEISGDASFASGSTYKVSICDMIIPVLDVTNYVWSIIIVKLYRFIHQLLKLLRRDNVASGGYNPFMRVAQSTDGRNQDAERRPQVPIPDVYLRKLRSGRVYDITPVLNNSPTETHHASGEHPQNRRSSPASDSSPFRRKQRLENWFGDSYRMRHEERLPDHVLRYGRPSSLLTSTSSPVALANMQSSFKVIESSTSRSSVPN